MDKKIAALLGAVAGIATAASAQAAIEPATNAPEAQASSYADLLKPVSNPVEALKADDAAREQQVAQYYYYGYPPAPYYRRYYHHHHHHHVKAVIGVPGVGGVVIH